MSEDKPLLDSFPTRGVITVLNWTMAPTGESFLYFWCAHWQIMTDKMIGDGFRSSERWQLLARDINGEILAVFPGCQVKGFIRGEFNVGLERRVCRLGNGA